MPRSERIGEFIYNRLVDVDHSSFDFDQDVGLNLFNISNADFMKLLLEYYNDT